MATSNKIRFRGVIRNVKEDEGFYGRVVKVTISGDDGNTYWFSTTTKFAWRLVRDETVVIEATEKDRRPSTYGDGEFVVVNRPKLVSNEGTDEVRNRRMAEDAERMKAEAIERGDTRTAEALDATGLTVAAESAQEPEDDFLGALEAAKARLRAKAPAPKQEVLEEVAEAVESMYGPEDLVDDGRHHEWVN